MSDLLNAVWAGFSAAIGLALFFGAVVVALWPLWLALAAIKYLLG